MDMPHLTVVVLGKGGREHALCRAIVASPHCRKLVCLPGNPGMGEIATCLDVDMMDNAAVQAACKTAGADFVVVGPDAPLANGVADALRACGIAVFGPSQAAARIESSKAFMKDICTEAAVPTARHRVFENKADALAYVASQPLPIVVKGDGLAAGKGAFVCHTLEQACAAVCKMASEGKVLVEEFMPGREVSFFTLHDGTGTVVPFAHARDYKRALDGDKGENTGGMGCFSPVEEVTEADAAEIVEHIAKPVDAALRARGCPFVGMLYSGLMRTPEGFKVVEFNARFGDPETQVMLPRLQSDILPLLWASANGRLAEVEAPRFSPQSCVTVVMASQGYPEAPRCEGMIGRVKVAEAIGALVFHAGTALSHGALVPNGGRVLNVTALGDDRDQARAKAYRAVEAIDWPEGFYRRDIGLDL